MLSDSEIDKRFGYHPADTGDKQYAHGQVRAGCKALAKFLNTEVPDGREKSIVFTKLEEVMYWANAGVARSMAANNNGTD